MAKRNIEVFTAGCPLCDGAVKAVEALACPNCEVPTVVSDGEIASCCTRGGVDDGVLRSVGVGASGK